MNSNASVPPTATPPHPHEPPLARLLVPLDGSGLAEEALPVAIALAQRAGTSGTVLLAQARRITSVLYSVGNQFDVRPEDLSDSDAYLAGMGEAISAQGVPSEVLKTQGDAALGIVDLAEEYRADLILLVTHAREGLGRLVHGSVADRVLHGATVPVLLLKQREPAPPIFAPDRPPHLLVPLDGSLLAESVLPLVQRLAQQVSAPVTVLRSLDLPDLEATGRGRAAAATAAIRESVPEARQQATEYLTRIQQRLSALGITTHLLVTEGEAAADISKATTALEEQEQQTVVIAMSTHGRSGLTRWLYGSVTGTLLHVTDAPLLVVRAR